MTGSAIRTLIVCVGTLHRFHTNLQLALAPGTGVVTSAGLYFSDVGNVFVFAGAVARLGERGRMAREFVGVVSGNMTMVLLGF